MHLTLIALLTYLHWDQKHFEVGFEPLHTYYFKKNPYTFISSKTEKVEVSFFSYLIFAVICFGRQKKVFSSQDVIIFMLRKQLTSIFSVSELKKSIEIS